MQRTEKAISLGFEVLGSKNFHMIDKPMYGAMTTVMKKWYSQRDSPMIKELARENAFVAPHDSPSPFAFAYDGSEEFYM